MTEMMIPSEMPVLSQSRGENGHANFGDTSNVFQNQDFFRSGIFGQLGSEQVQMLQNLQQMGQKQKEVGQVFLLISFWFESSARLPYYSVAGTVFVLLKDLSQHKNLPSLSGVEGEYLTGLFFPA